MDLQNIRIFVLCTKYLSFSKVAELTYSSQSSISKAVAALEAEVGGELFIRSSRRIELTALGEALLPYAEGVLTKEEEMRGFLHQFHSGAVVIPLVIGVARFLLASPTDGLLMPLMDAVEQLRRLHPEADVKIAYFEERQLADLVNGHRIDVAITAVNNNMVTKHVFPGADFLRLNEHDNYLLVRTDGREDVTVSDVLPQMDCLFSVSDQIAMSVTYDFLRKVKTPIRVETCDNWSEVIVKVKNGQGGTILGASTAKFGIQCGLTAIPLTEYDVTSSLVAIWKHGSGTVIEETACLLRNALSDDQYNVMKQR